ncbi:hypothetical protein AgCh_037187 [Apium graveolens]
MNIWITYAFKTRSHSQENECYREDGRMDVLCSDKTGTLTLNKLTVDQDSIEVFAKDFTKEHMLLFAARASRTENQDAIDVDVMIC